jgi:ribonuclease HI
MTRATEKPQVEIFTDGACSGNPGPGGYGVILRSGERGMELTAAIKGLDALKKTCRVKLFSDSNYLVQGMTSWIFQWVRNGWRNSQKQQVLNKDLWEILFDLSRRHEVKWIWVKGHNEHPENERCDQLARRAIKKCEQVSEPALSRKRKGGSVRG